MKPSYLLKEGILSLAILLIFCGLSCDVALADEPSKASVAGTSTQASPSAEKADTAAKSSMSQSDNHKAKSKKKTVNKVLAKKDRVSALDSGPDIYAPVPTSVVDFNRYSIPASSKAPYHVEVTVSNWAPSSYANESYVGAGNFSADTPKLSLNLWSASWQWKEVDFTPKYGLSYEQLLRNGLLPIYGQTINSTEVMNLMSVRFGVEVRPHQDLFGQLQPFAALAILPTLAESPTSGVNDGSTKGFVSLEGTLGLNWNIPGLGPMIGAQKVGIEIGIDGTQGILGSPLTGLGFLAGTRVEL